MTTTTLTNQLTSTVLMVRPANFGFNPETADNNAFQVDDASLSSAEIKAKAMEEFDTFVDKLRSVGIGVIVVEDTQDPLKTDAVFPNNWITFHEDGLIVTYSMFSPNRRLERRQDIVDQLTNQFDFKNHVRLEKWEADEQFLEGTGSLILDRQNRIVYACISERTHPKLLDEFCEFMGFQKVLFRSVDKDGFSIYHTNVMMALGDHFVVICLDCIPDETEQAILKQYFRRTNKTIIPITMDQVYAFAGNMLQLKNKTGDTYLVMSSQAYHSLSDAQITQIQQYTSILHSDITTIETYGGGSARCMLAEVFYR